MSRPIPILAAAALVALSGCSGQPASSVVDLDDWQSAIASADAGRAKALFARARDLPGEPEPVSCADCHGAEGGGNYGRDNPRHIAPRLAGLNPVYVGEQLRAYQHGARVFPLMQAMTKPLSTQDVADLAVYVHDLRASRPAAPEVPLATLTRGQQLWAHGLPGQAASCASCHGVDGAGKVLRSPEIAGQPIPYLVAQLRTMHDHGRHGSTPADTMTEETRRLSDADLVAVASYIASIEPVSAREHITAPARNDP